MNQPRYPVQASSNQLHYEFISVGHKGNILKAVEYTYIEDLNVWNLGFGDYDSETNEIDDTVVSNNGDGRKVLATVASTVIDFFVEHPGETVLFMGSTDRRTQVYNRAIEHYWQDFSDDFVVMGIDQMGNLRAFTAKLDFEAFIIKQK